MNFEAAAMQAMEDLSKINEEFAIAYLALMLRIQQQLKKESVASSALKGRLLRETAPELT